MRVHVRKKLLHDRLGMLLPGRIVELPDHQAEFHIRRGEVELYATKVLRDRPLPAVGAEEPSSASPAAPALPQTIASESALGAKRRGRARKTLSS